LRGKFNRRVEGRDSKKKTRSLGSVRHIKGQDKELTLQSSTAAFVGGWLGVCFVLFFWVLGRPAAKHRKGIPIEKIPQKKLRAERRFEELPELCWPSKKLFLLPKELLTETRLIGAVGTNNTE